MHDDHVTTLIWKGVENETLDVIQLTTNMALVERWRQETNSFQFIFDARTTLEDVNIILDFFINCHTVTHTELEHSKSYWETNREDLRITREQWAEMYSRPFGRIDYIGDDYELEMMDMRHMALDLLPLIHFEMVEYVMSNKETEEVRETIGQWKWVEDKLLISAWLNVSLDALIGTDQKAEEFWDRIHQYCEEDNHGVMKRRVMAMKKRWQRINERAQKYGSRYDEALGRVGSGSNLDNIIEEVLGPELS
ncbi:hypothetical protein AgCh_034121 [Apium graveolens]